LSEANQDDNATAQSFFQRAINLDSTFAGGYGLALAPGSRRVARVP
jgi:hypothetical protein